jgi:hypothetical protein
MRRKTQRNCKVALLLFLAAAGIVQFVSNGASVGHGDRGDANLPQLKKPRRVFNGSVFVPGKELGNLAGLGPEGQSAKAGAKAISSLSGERSNMMTGANDTGGVFAEGILDDPTSVLKSMKEINEAQYVRNEEIFGPVSNKTIVIAIQGCRA